LVGSQHATGAGGCGATLVSARRAGRLARADAALRASRRAAAAGAAAAGSAAAGSAAAGPAALSQRCHRDDHHRGGEECCDSLLDRHRVLSSLEAPKLLTHPAGVNPTCAAPEFARLLVLCASVFGDAWPLCFDLQSRSSDALRRKTSAPTWKANRSPAYRRLRTGRASTAAPPSPREARRVRPHHQLFVGKRPCDA